MYNYRPETLLVDLFGKYASKNRQPVSNALVDYFGCVIPIDCVPHLKSRAGQVIVAPPFPDDSFRATAIEYQSVIESIEDCNTDNFTFFELGASYAPFCTLVARLTRYNEGIRRVYLRAVEAAKNGFEAIEANFNANGMLNSEYIDYKVINAALGPRFDKAEFPDLDCTIDNGGGISPDGCVDIRGVPTNMISVDLVPLDYVIDSLSISNICIDLIHFDLQGSEGDVITSALGLLNKFCKRVLIGTHSRYLEGYLFELFEKNGWLLLGEEPCKFEPIEGRSVCGMTTKDGNLYFVNKRFLVNDNS
jgi:FkbM family methyltransferase